MPSGFEVINSHGVSTITDSSIVFSLLAKGHFNYSSTNTRLDISTSRPAVNAILAVVPKNTPVTFTRLISSSTLQVSYDFGSTVAQTFEWFLFDSAPPPPNSVKSGLEVYRQDRTLVFASQTPVMKIVDFAFNHFTYSKTVPSGKRYAVALSNTYTYRLSEIYSTLERSDPDYDWYRENFQNTSKTAAYRQVGSLLDMVELTSSSFTQGNLHRVPSDDPPPFPDSHREDFLGQTVALVVDVTNY